MLMRLFRYNLLQDNRPMRVDDLNKASWSLYESPGSSRFVPTKPSIRPYVRTLWFSFNRRAVNRNLVQSVP